MINLFLRLFAQPYHRTISLSANGNNKKNNFRHLENPLADSTKHITLRTEIDDNMQLD